MAFVSGDVLSIIEKGQLLSRLANSRRNGQIVSCHLLIVPGGGGRVIPKARTVMHLRNVKQC